MKLRNILILGAGLFTSSVAISQTGERPDRGERRGPPPEAFEACANLVQGDSCTVETPRGQLSGSCEMPRGEELVCVPEGHERGRRGPPPTEGESRPDTEASNQFSNQFGGRPGRGGPGGARNNPR